MRYPLIALTAGLLCLPAGADAQCQAYNGSPCGTFDNPKPLDFSTADYGGIAGVVSDEELLAGTTDVYAFQVYSPGGLYLTFGYGSATDFTAPVVTLYDSARAPIYTLSLNSVPYSAFSPYAAADGPYYIGVAAESGPAVTIAEGVAVVPQGEAFEFGPDLPPARIGPVAAVPEPGALTLIGSALPVMVAIVRRRRRS